MPLAQISRTNVVDDFYLLCCMRYGKIRRSPVPHWCIGLKNESKFMFWPSLSLPCDPGIIAVLSNYEFGFRPAEA